MTSSPDLASESSGEHRVEVERWPTETPLFVLVVLAAVAIWLLLAVTVFGVIYVGLIGLFLFLAHVSFVAHVRGSAVRLGPDQFPELHARVLELAARAGIDPVPEAYLMEAGGSLNAFATRFLRSRLIVLFSDLLDACEGDEQARDMVIGHELGHIRAGHLRFTWLLAPGLILPFVGSAYSRACEYTCDRWGQALCGSAQGGARGLAILAAGGRLARRVDLRSFARQSTQLDTGWMTIGRWLSRYPPLCDRVAALQPELREDVEPSIRGPVRAVALLVSLVVVPGVVVAGAFMALTFGMGALASLVPDVSEEDFDSGFELPEPAPLVEDVEAAAAQVESDFAMILRAAARYRAMYGELPADVEELEPSWSELFPDQPFPLDPFDGRGYGWDARSDGTVLLFSSGPDGSPYTDDDIELESEVAPEDDGGPPEA